MSTEDKRRRLRRLVPSWSFLTRLRRPYLFPCAGKDRGEKGAWMRLVLSASEFRRGPGFQASFHSEVTLRVSAARRLIRGAKFAASCLRVYLKTPNAPGQRTFSRCAAPFFLEIRQYSCEKMSCSAQKFLAAGHIGSFQIHPRTFAVNRRCRPNLLVCTFLRGSFLCWEVDSRSLTWYPEFTRVNSGGDTDAALSE